MTVKEALVEAIRAKGYDFVTACEHAQRFIDDIKKEPAGTEWTLAGVTVRKN